MILKIDNNIEKEFILKGTIPKFQGYDEINLHPGDTLVFTIDSYKWDIEAAQEFYKVLENAFPRNNILILFDGIELKNVIREERVRYGESTRANNYGETGRSYTRDDYGLSRTSGSPSRDCGISTTTTEDCQESFQEEDWLDKWLSTSI